MEAGRVHMKEGKREGKRKERGKNEQEAGRKGPSK